MNESLINQEYEDVWCVQQFSTRKKMPEGTKIVKPCFIIAGEKEVSSFNFAI